MLESQLAEARAPWRALGWRPGPGGEHSHEVVHSELKSELDKSRHDVEQLQAELGSADSVQELERFGKEARQLKHARTHARTHARSGTVGQAAAGGACVIAGW